MKRFNIRNSAALSAMIAAALFVSCGDGKKSAGKGGKAGEDAEQENVYAVNAAIAREGNLDDYLEFGGDVSSVSAVDVFPDVAGKIARIVVAVGDTVERNQVIAYVDASKPGMNYAANPVKSPIAGTVTSFPPTLGTMVSQGYSIAKVSDTDELQIKVNVAERFISRIQLGQKAVVTFDAYPGVEFEAKVFEVSPVLDTTSRTMLVKMRVEPADSRIRVGMFARVRLITETIENAVVIPSSAIVRRDNKPYIFVAHDEKSMESRSFVSMVAVREGLTVDNKTEIREGLKNGDVIIVKGQSLLSDGSKVKILALDGTSVDGNQRE